MSLAGSFLVARPVLKEQTFARTVVFLVEHNDDGAFGLVVNRPSKFEGVPFPVHVGGPCPCPGLLMLHGHADWVADAEDPPEDGGKHELAPGIFIGDLSCLERVSKPAETDGLRFRVFKDYSGWGSGQLEGELEAGAWAVVPATSELLFDTPSDELWSRLLPPSIPQPSLN